LIPAIEYQQIKRPEERLRLPLAKVLKAAVGVREVDLLYRPAMPFWPRVEGGRLGEFDLAITVSGMTAPATVCELKWSQHTGVDALDDVMWDLFKLAHARYSLPNVRSAYLIYAAPTGSWQPATRRFRQLFTTTETDVAELVDKYLSIWRWCVRNSSKSRPVALPNRIHTSGVGESVTVEVPAGSFAVRVASVDVEWDPPIALDGNTEVLRLGGH
jgi:hypothetical protein